MKREANTQYMEIPGVFTVYTGLNERKKGFPIRIIDVNGREVEVWGPDMKLVNNRGFNDLEMEYIYKYLINNRRGLICNAGSVGGWVENMLDKGKV